MLNYLKQWYEENFTDPNQVSLALIVIFSVLITYILIQTISPILVAIVLAYMLEGLVQNLMKTAHIVRNISVIVVFLIFLILSVITLFMLIPLLLDQLTLFVKSLPEIFDKSKNLILGMYDQNEYIPKDYIDSIFLGLQGETSKLGNSIFAFSLASAGGLFAIIVYTILVPIMIFFMLFDKDAINGWIEGIRISAHPIAFISCRMMFSIFFSIRRPIGRKLYWPEDCCRTKPALIISL